MEEVEINSCPSGKKLGVGRKGSLCLDSFVATSIGLEMEDSSSIISSGVVGMTDSIER